MAEHSTTESADFASLSSDPAIFMEWNWAQYEMLFNQLLERPLDASSLDSWMRDWTTLQERVSETYMRLNVRTRRDTNDDDGKKRLTTFLNDVFSPAQEFNQKLKLKLIESGLKPENFDHPLRVIQTEVKLFREENLDLFNKEKEIQNEYDNIASAQSVIWENEVRTLPQMEPISLESDRAKRERAWNLIAARQLDDRTQLNNLWQKGLNLRQQIADNAGYSDYTAFRWDQLARFDYTPHNCAQFHDAIEEAVVPAFKRLLERRRGALEVDVLRPWDLNVDIVNQPPLAPFSTGDELAKKSSAIFHKVDPELGKYFDIMIDDDLLDLENRRGKGPGGFCTTYHTIKKPFIFMNAVGLQRDVRTMLHEAGHAFHAFEKVKLPYMQQRQVGAEYNEVASMAMELLCSPYLTHEHGGFYSEEEAARARIQHLEGIISFWPYMAVVDGFQHWAYGNPEEAMDPSTCDAQWDKLWARFMPVIDWTGLEEERKTGWHRKLHIFHYPFYYVEYGLAQLCSIQIWANALQNQPKALQQYLDGLALGSTVPLPQLYETSGAEFAFDAGTMTKAVTLLESVIEELRSP